MMIIEIIIYLLIYIIGALFGSFFTLAVYRIPLGENILYKHSFCPNCKEKLKFKDLIPILSYIFLRGKCAYCGQQIRIRYFLLEILSGAVFLLFAVSFNFNIYQLEINKIIYFTFFILYISILFIIAGIDKEKIEIEEALSIFSIIVSFLYMTYVCVTKIETIYTYIIYFPLLTLLLIADRRFLRKKLKQSYMIRIIILILVMNIFSLNFVTYLTIIFTLILIALHIICLKIKEKYIGKDKQKFNRDAKIPIAFYLCVCNICLNLLII